MPKVVSKEEMEIRNNLLVSGLSYSEIASRLNVTPSTIWYHAKKYDLTIYRNSPLMKANFIKEQLDKGLSVKAIAGIMKINPPGVYSLMRKFNIRAPGGKK